ncbi:hypothetical protein DMH88_02540 [Escherichia coli]|nr:hypothetical protein [Escherichia coli]
MPRRWLAESEAIYCWLFLATAGGNIRQPAHGVSVAAVHTQGLLVIAFGGGIIFARHRHIARPSTAWLSVLSTLRCLLEQPFCPVRIIGFQRIALLLDRQPVAVSFQQTVPFVVIAVVRIQREGFSRFTTALARSPFWEYAWPSAPEPHCLSGSPAPPVVVREWLYPPCQSPPLLNLCARARKGGSASCFVVLPVAIAQQPRYRHR